MKLIIDIPEELVEEEHFYTEEELWTVIRATENGIPLDDVKAEIDAQYDGVRPYNIDVAQGLEMALDILDNIGKTESEVKPNE